MRDHERIKKTASRSGSGKGRGDRSRQHYCYYCILIQRAGCTITKYCKARKCAGAELGDAERETGRRPDDDDNDFNPKNREMNHDDQD